MTVGTQEILAIAIVAAIVCFALYRRLRKKGSATSACSGCDHQAAEPEAGKTVRFFKKRG